MHEDYAVDVNSDRWACLPRYRAAAPVGTGGLLLLSDRWA
jgi:hypothetical protein